MAWFCIGFIVLCLLTALVGSIVLWILTAAADSARRYYTWLDARRARMVKEASNADTTD